MESTNTQATKGYGAKHSSLDALDPNLKRRILEIAKNAIDVINRGEAPTNPIKEEKSVKPPPSPTNVLEQTITFV